MANGKFRLSNYLFLAVVALILVILIYPAKKPAPKSVKAVPAAVTVSANSVSPAVANRYKAIADSLDMSRVKASVDTLSSCSSRLVGYPGCEAAADYVESQFKEIGLKDIHSESFKVTVPVDQGSRLVIGKRQFPIYALWPNLVRTSSLPPEGINVHVIDAGSGRLPDFDGTVVKGSAALVDFNSGTEWLNAPRLGAKVLLFVEPDATMRGEAESKFSAIPVSMPRFWISKNDAAQVKTLIKSGSAQDARVFCKMPWEKVNARNIVGVIRGSDPKLRDQWIVLHASYDGTSVVPALAPSAEPACGISGMLELARLYSNPEFRPRRSVMFIATSGHFQGLAGMRAYMEKHIDSYRIPGASDKYHAYMNSHWPVGAQNPAVNWPPVLITLVLLAIVWAIWRRIAPLQKRMAWIVVVPIVLAVLVFGYGHSLNSAFHKGFDYQVPDPPQFYIWAGLDLSSQTKSVGVFYKGYFYDMREDIQSKFSDLATRARENSERIAAILGPRAGAFADGVNPISGKNWRNFVPGKFALDSEVVTLAGGKGVSLVSVDDGRQLVDTPFDTANRVNFDNLGKQLTLVACIADHWFHDTKTMLEDEVVEAKVADRKTVKLVDPLRIGYVVGVYTDAKGKGESYFKPKSDKYLPASLAKGELKLTKALPHWVKRVYVCHKPISRLGVDERCSFSRMGLQGGFARLSGNVVQYDPRKGFVPNIKVKDCLAVVRSPYRSFMGVRANIIDKTSRDKGAFNIPGVAPVTAYNYQRKTAIGAYKLDSVNGDIVMAPDQGAYGEVYPTEFLITTGYKDMPVIVFDCKATSVYDLVDPQSLSALTMLNIYDGITNGAPKQFGCAVAVPEPGNPHVEDMAVIFTEDTNKKKQLAIGSSQELRRIRIKLMMSAGPAAIRLLLLNSTLGNEVVPADIVSADGKSIKLDQPIETFIEGVYADPKCKQTNYCRTQDNVYNDPSLIEGRIKLTSDLPAGTKRVFIKMNPSPIGIGYDFTQGGTLEETAFKVAHDMWKLDESRLAGIEAKGVKDEGLQMLHQTSRRYLDLAENARNSHEYSVFDSYCRAAWGYEARAYPGVSKLSQDVVNGVIFYLFLIIPFSFFCERLFFGYPTLWKQLTAFFLIFLAVCGVFYLVHPAFQITGPANAFIVLLAFVMLALSLLVISIVSGKFEEQLKQMNRSVGGIHKADIGRMSVAAAAFSLGISNMRRRKARTVLTCTTLVLLTFTVLSFTSIQSVLRFNKIPAPKDADTHVYDGIMIRTPMWSPLQEIAYRLLKDEFGNAGKRGKVYPVAPRSWFFGTILGEQSFLTLRNGDASYDAKAACGMTPEEVDIMDLNTKNRKAILAGDWFGYKNGKRVPGKVDPYSIIIPDAVATALNIKPSDVGKAKIEFAGAKYTVVAITRTSVYKRIKDLDNEQLTPVDFIMMNKQNQQQGGDAGFREYQHLDPNTVFTIPYDTLMGMGGDIRSIAIKFASFEEVQKQLDALMPRLGLNLYAGMDGSIYRYSSISSSSSKGFSNVFIPVLIAALIVLNTMLGSVYERIREIGIFSAIGLAPNHIAVLFIAESMVYANLGAVAGYVLGQTASKILYSTNALPGLYLNFSSMSAVTSTLVVVAVVLLSALYPARKASEVATPAVDRSWKVPEPDGDDWEIMLPFAVTGEQAVGVNGFLKEWFQAYEDYSIGDFVTQGVTSGESETEYGKSFSVGAKTWLAPFDLGVSQTVDLHTIPTDMEDVYEVKLKITRESGDVSNWKRVNRRFLNTLRKQFLIWRTMRASEREKYLAATTAEDARGTETAKV
ncbi:M28 family peptidase [bacterium]|nr:M28 family peptidase [bacterium]